MSSPNEVVSKETQTHYHDLIAKRARGVPVAYLTGRREFWSLELEVNEHTLIPRPETEHLVEVALDLIQTQGIRCLADLGTGSGAIALAIASEYPKCQIVATDITGEALKMACRNATHLGFHTISFRRGDWCEALEGMSFDLIVSNPPYIPSGDPALKEGNLRFEPAIALAGGPNGLEAIERIIAQAGAHLHLGGWLALEHGCDQGDPVRKLLQAKGFHSIHTMRDYSGHERVTIARYGRL